MLFAVACGDNGGNPGRPDAPKPPPIDAPKPGDAAIDAPNPGDASIDAAIDAPNPIDAQIDAAIDAPNPIDAPVDAPIDAPIDAPPPGPASRIWVTGAISAANDGLSFVDGDPAIPYSDTNRAPVEFIARALDARGDKVVYGFKELTLADADGGHPTLLHLVPGGAAGNVEITSTALSPDGTKVVFTRDSPGAAGNGAIDLYFMPTATPAAIPVKVSPNRAAGQGERSDVSQLSANPEDLDLSYVHQWSPNSQYVAFMADLNRDNAVEVYLLDTSNTSNLVPVAVLSASELGANPPPTGSTNPPVIGGNAALQFDAENNLYFRARLNLPPAADSKFKIFKVTPAGVRTEFPLPPRADTTEAGPFAISSDGTKIVFAADAPNAGRFDIYTATLAAPATATRLTELAGPGVAAFQMPLQVSPDGTQLAVIGNFTSSDRFEPHVVKLDGTTLLPRRLVNISQTCVKPPTPPSTDPGPCEGARLADADRVQWTADSRGVYVMGELTKYNTPFIFRLDPALTDQQPTLAVQSSLAPPNGRAKQLLVRPIPIPQP